MVSLVEETSEVVEEMASVVGYDGQSDILESYALNFSEDERM